MMEIFIKNMVCDRCVMLVRKSLDDLSIKYNRVELGEVQLEEMPDPQKLSALQQNLNDLGFDILDDRKASLISRMKSYIIQYVHGEDEELANKKLSVLLADKLQTDYNYLSALFSSIEGITIERFVILQRIERVKELLEYNELSLGEIAWKMNYSSVQHLSQQFKKVTGLTPSQYKLSTGEGRKSLDQVGA